MSLVRKTFAVRPQEERRNMVGKSRRAVSMSIANLVRNVRKARKEILKFRGRRVSERM